MVTPQIYEQMNNGRTCHSKDILGRTEAVGLRDADRQPNKAKEEVKHDQCN
jgi:hypothetical protein